MTMENFHLYEIGVANRFEYVSRKALYLFHCPGIFQTLEITQGTLFNQLSHPKLVLVIVTVYKLEKEQAQDKIP